MVSQAYWGTLHEQNLLGYEEDLFTYTAIHYIDSIRLLGNLHLQKVYCAGRSGRSGRSFCCAMRTPVFMLCCNAITKYIEIQQQSH
jgi:hypothetical protein